MNIIKTVIVGDGMVGKTSMLMCYVNNDFPGDYVPTVFDNFIANVSVDGQVYQLALWDTAGQDEFDRLRPLSYPQTDVFLVVFSVDRPESLENVREKWFPEIKHYNPETPAILVANKLDLRDDSETVRKLGLNGHKPVSYTQGAATAHKFDAVHYAECSAKTHKGLKALFDHTIRVVVDPQIVKMRRKRRHKCVLF